MFECEKDASEDIARQKAVIDTLNKKLKELNRKYDELLTNFENNKEHMCRLEKDNNDFTLIKESMLSSMRTLEADNRALHDELTNLQEELIIKSKTLDDLKKVSMLSTTMNARSSFEALGKDYRDETVTEKAKIQNSEHITPKRKLVILTDNYGAGLFGCLSKIKVNYDIQVISKPNAKFKDIVYTADCHIEGLTDVNDYDIRVNDVISVLEQILL